MKVPSCVLWSLTKKNNCFLAQPKGSKSRNEQFSYDPTNLTGLNNASASGFINDSGIGLLGDKAESKAKKAFRRDYILKVNHKSYHKSAQVTKGTDGVAGLRSSTLRIKKGTAHAAKSIKGLTFANDKKKALLLKRLGKLHAATRVNVKGAGKK